MYQILVVDDEPKIVEILQIYLEMQGYKVIPAFDGEMAYDIWQNNKIDMVIADIMMPKMNGYILVENIRKSSTVPIIFLTAKSDTEERIKGLNLGTDDYIVKPFEPMEVVARVMTNLRRCYGYESPKVNTTMKCKDIEIDKEKMTVKQGGNVMELTAMEYRMLAFFVENKNKVLTKNQIYEAVWEENAFPDDNSIMVAISKLRHKIKDDENNYIKTIRGLGYRMEE